MDTGFVASQDNFEFTTLKEIVVGLLQNTGYLVDASTTGVATGFDNIDAITKGFQQGELSVIASKPGSGKTAFLLSLLFNIASKSGKTVGLFSPERSAVKMFHRLINNETHHSVQQIMSGSLKDSEKEFVHNSLYALSQAEIYVDDTTSLTEKDFHKRCKQLKNKFGADIIFVDGLELISFPDLSDIDEDTSEPHYVLNDFKKVAKELDLPIVVFSHLANTSTFGNDTIPTLENVYDFMPKIADSIYLIHRQNMEDKANIIIAQHPIIKESVVIPLKFIESIDKFVDFGRE